MLFMAGLVRDPYALRCTGNAEVHCTISCHERTSGDGRGLSASPALMCPPCASGWIGRPYPIQGAHMVCSPSPCYQPKSTSVSGCIGVAGRARQRSSPAPRYHVAARMQALMQGIGGFDRCDRINTRSAAAAGIRSRIWLTKFGQSKPADSSADHYRHLMRVIRNAVR